MLSVLQQLAAETLANMGVSDREEALKRGHIMISVAHSAGSGAWTPVNLDADVVAAALEMYFKDDSAK